MSFPSRAFRPGYLVSFTLCQRLDERPFTRSITRVAENQVMGPQRLARPLAAIKIKEVAVNRKEISHH